MRKSTSILYEGGGDDSPDESYSLDKGHLHDKNHSRDKSQSREIKRIDLDFERMVVACGIGCIVNDIDLSDNDYVRLYLAFSRLSKKHE